MAVNGDFVYILSADNIVFFKRDKYYAKLNIDAPFKITGIILLGKGIGLVNPEGRVYTLWDTKDGRGTIVFPSIINIKIHGMSVRSSIHATNMGEVNAVFLCSNVHDDSFFIRAISQGREISLPIACDDNFIAVAGPDFIPDKFIFYVTSTSSCI